MAKTRSRVSARSVRRTKHNSLMVKMLVLKYFIFPIDSGMFMFSLMVITYSEVRDEDIYICRRLVRCWIRQGVSVKHEIKCASVNLGSTCITYDLFIMTRAPCRIFDSD